MWDEMQSVFIIGWEAVVTARVNYPDLDLAKLLMAFLVVEIHTRPLSGIPAAEFIVRGIDVLAVPFFFIASAFLCFRGLKGEHFATADSRGSVRVRKTTGRLLRLYLTWTVIFLPVTVFCDVLQGRGLLWSVASFIRGTLFVGHNLYSWPLWYLLASVIAFALVYLLLRGGVSSRRLLAISAAFLLAGYLLTVLKGWGDAPAAVALPVKAYFAVFATVGNGLFEGFFYVALGAVLGMRHERLGMMPVAAPLSATVLGVLGCLFVSSDAHLPFCAVASTGVFLLSVRRHGSELRPHVAARNASTIIYLVHMLFVVAFVFGICGGTSLVMDENDVNRSVLYLFALGGSGLLSLVVIALAKRVPLVKRVFGI